ncbi:putative histone-lysine N-methyltransferase [Rosa chinensis]|uniref:Putative histone-lysine N-methyltransferase n=2 Tax=Rosa chinensis TaxID=74649 RepID=A0A2P6RGU6_ROSCH|nr:putative histone-lysine N-methyltransferase [Rosa chinensis]
MSRMGIHGEKDERMKSNPDLYFNCATVNKYLENYEMALTGFDAAALKDPGLNATKEVQKIVNLLDKLDNLLRGHARSKRLASLASSLAVVNCYMYCKSIQVAQNVKLPRDATGCNCKGSCVDSKTCQCAKLNGSDFPYVHRDGGRLIEAKDVVFECGPKCGCGPSMSTVLLRRSSSTDLRLCFTTAILDVLQILMLRGTGLFFTAFALHFKCDSWTLKMKEDRPDDVCDAYHTYFGVVGIIVDAQLEPLLLHKMHIT